MKGKWMRGLVRAAAYLGCAQFVFLAFVQNPGNPESFEKARLTEMIDRTAHRPFVARALLPYVVGVIEWNTSDWLSVSFENAAWKSRPLMALLESTPAADEKHPFTYFVAYGLEFLSLIGFALVLRAGVRYFYPEARAAREVVPLAALLGLPVFFRYVSYDYDFPQLFLFTLGLLLLAQRRWWLFYPVLVLGALSKETTVLLVLVHLLAHAGSMGRRALWVHGAVQFALVAGIRAWLQLVVFADNPGGAVEWHLPRNLALLGDPGRWPFLFLHFHWVGRTGAIYPTNFNVLFLLAAPLVLGRWREKPLFLRRALWIAAPLLAGALCLGHFDELRDYYEVYPVVVLLGTHGLLTLFGPILDWPAGGSAAAAEGTPT